MNLTNFGAGFALGFFARSMISKLFKRIASAARGIFRAAVTKARVNFNAAVKAGTFDMANAIDEDAKEFNTSSRIKNWLRSYYADNAYKGLLLQGHLYMFDYTDPLHKDKLQYYDTSPLVLSFGIYYAKTGNLIEYGVNLHFLPLDIRKAFMIDIFELFKKRFKGEMYSDKPRSVNEFTWEILQTYVDKYHIDFAVRSYVYDRRKNCCYFDYADWSKAILIPSKGFIGTDERAIKKLYDIHAKRRIH